MPFRTESWRENGRTFKVATLGRRVNPASILSLAGSIHMDFYFVSNTVRCSQNMGCSDQAVERQPGRLGNHLKALCDARPLPVAVQRLTRSLTSHRNRSIDSVSELSAC